MNIPAGYKKNLEKAVTECYAAAISFKAFPTKENFTNLILNHIETENEWFTRFMKNNPDDTTRKKEHEIILAVYTRILHDIKETF